MAIDLANFAVDDNDEDVEMLKEMSREFANPISYKIRNEQVCIKGGKKINCRDITKFKVNKDTRMVKPVWACTAEEDGKVVDMLPLLSYGIPSALMLASELFMSAIPNPNLEINVYPDEVCRIGVVFAPDSLNDLLPLCDSMYPSCPELHTRESVMFAEQLLTSKLNGDEMHAASIMSIISQKPQLIGCWVVLTDIVEEDCVELGSFSSHTYLSKNKFLSNTELTCVQITAIFCYHMFMQHSMSSHKFGDLSEVDSVLQNAFFDHLGVDEFGSLVVGDLWQDKEGPKGISINEYHASERWMDIYDAPSVPYDVWAITGVYNIEAIGLLIRSTQQADQYVRSVDKYRGRIREIVELQESNERVIKKLSNDKDEVLLKMEDMERKHKEEIAKLVYERDVARDRCARYEEEIQMYRDTTVSYYSDDDGQEEEKLKEHTLEERIAFINDYSIMVAGGDANFMERLSKIGVTSVTQYTEKTRLPVSARFDFYCIASKYIGHKTVWFVQSNFNTQGCLFYFNGTNAEKFVIAASDFITSYFD